MNVVIVNDFAYVNGGVGQVALASARELGRRGHRVHVFTAVPGSEPIQVEAGLEVTCLGQHEIAADPQRMRAMVQGIWNTRARTAMRMLLEHLDPSDTVVHFHGWTKALSSSVIRETLARHFEAVITLHEYFSACPNGGFYLYPQQRNCRVDPLSWACVSTDCDPRNYAQKLWRVGRHWVQMHVARYPRDARHFIAITDFSLQILRRYLPTEAHIHHVRNPIQIERQAPAPVGSNAGFVYVGRLSPEKGALLLAKAAAAANVPVTFIGDGPERDAIAAANPAARLAGWQDKAGVAAAIRASRALVLPSLWFETQGLVVSEAAAMGVAAIVADECAAREAVVNGETGLWFRSRDEDDLSAKLLALHHDARAAQAMGQAAHARFWQDPPTLARHVESLESVYAAILANRNGARAQQEFVA